MRSKKGLIFIYIGLLLIAMAFCLTMYNIWDAKRADAAANAAADRLAAEIDHTMQAEGDGEELEVPDYILNPDMEMPEVEFDGVNYVGVLEIPALDIRLPVIGQWSYRNLKTAPCRYMGTAYRSGFVIAAHNYAGHFGRLKSLSQGDDIYFTDTDGNVFCYSVASVESLAPSAIEDMITDEWDLSLFTCTTGGQYRFTVRCERAGNMKMQY